MPVADDRGDRQDRGEKGWALELGRELGSFVSSVLAANAGRGKGGKKGKGSRLDVQVLVCQSLPC